MRQPKLCACAVVHSSDAPGRPLPLSRRPCANFNYAIPVLHLQVGTVHGPSCRCCCGCSCRAFAQHCKGELGTWVTEPDQDSTTERSSLSGCRLALGLVRVLVWASSRAKSVAACEQDASLRLQDIPKACSVRIQSTVGIQNHCPARHNVFYSAHMRMHMVLDRSRRVLLPSAICTLFTGCAQRLLQTGWSVLYFLKTT